MKLVIERSSLELQRNFLTVRTNNQIAYLLLVCRYSNAGSLQEKIGQLSCLGYNKISCLGQRVRLEDLEGPFHFYYCMILSMCDINWSLITAACQLSFP